MIRISVALSILSIIACLMAVARADDAIFAAPAQPVPTADSAIPLQVSRSKAEALVADGASVEQVSEQEAIKRAASHGVALQPRSPSDPNYGHPWAIIKAGFGYESEINALVEIYVNDNWTINPHLNVGLNYSATMIGVGWRPDALCWGCKGKAGVSIGFGVEGGARNNTDDTNDARTGAMFQGAVDAEAFYRPMKHLIFTAGLRASGGAFFESPTYINIYSNPGPVGGTPGGPAPTPTAPTIIGRQEDKPFRVVGTGDVMLYIGVGF